MFFGYCYLHDCHMLDTLLWRLCLFSIISKAVSVSTAFLLNISLGTPLRPNMKKWRLSLTFVPFDMHINVFLIPTCLPVRICMDISHISQCILRTMFSLYKVCVAFILWIYINTCRFILCDIYIYIYVMLYTCSWSRCMYSKPVTNWL